MPAVLTVVVAAPAGPARLSATATVRAATTTSSDSLSISSLPAESPDIRTAGPPGLATMELVERGFWARLPGPIVGLSPMDGVTDAVARRMAVRHGRPDLTITEFVA